MTERPGKYIVIEGHDGTGKSTQVTRIRERLATRGIDSIEISEPAKDPKDGPEEVLIASEIRTLIKNGNLQRDAVTNLLLFSAAAHELWVQKAGPALALGKYAVAARSDISRKAYQGYGEGIDLGLIDTITAIATDEKYMNPDIAVILDLDDEEERRKRIEARGPLENPDTFESKDDAFQARVRAGYVDIALKRGIPIISAAKPIPEVTDNIWAIIEPHLV